MASTDFLGNFNNSISKLASITKNVQSNLDSRKQFTANLIDKLRAVNQKIRELAKGISGLKNDVKKLQDQLNVNVGAINDNSAQINDLKEQITKLESEKQQLIAQFSNLKAQVDKDKAAAQQRIDACEQSLRKVTDERNALKTQIDALNADAATKGNQHAEVIDKMTQDFNNQLTAKETSLKNRESELINEIQDREAKIKDCDEQLRQAKDNLALAEHSIKSGEQTYVDQINNLKLENSKLSGLNDNLKNKIIAATTAIIDASNGLEALMNSEPMTSQADIDNALQEIERSLVEISNSIQGTGASASSSSASSAVSSSKLPGTTVINFGGKTFTLQELLWQLRLKDQKIKNDPDNKYARSIQIIRNANSPEEVVGILSRENVSLTSSGYIRGGKTRKGGKNKIKKIYKGGFIYKSNKKRRSLSTSSKMSSRRTIRTMPTSSN
jgi:DNA repair exonuclease SbcCD ATPase subunit